MRKTVVTTFLTLACASGAASASQLFDWVPGPGLSTTNGTILASTMWDPDGEGPVAPLLVAGGMFSVAGSRLNSGIATYDLATNEWQPLGSADSNNPTLALFVAPDNTLYRGDRFGVTRWTGSEWARVGSFPFTSPSIGHIAVDAAGTLYAASDTTILPGQPVNLQRWNGTNWVAVTEIAVGPQCKLALGNDGRFFAGTRGGWLYQRVGSAWSSVPAAGISTQNFAITPDNRLLVGYGGIQVFFREVTGTTAVTIPGSVAAPSASPTVRAMTALPDSSVIVAGTFPRFFTTEWQTWRQLVRFDNATRSWRPIAVPPQRGGNPVIPAWQGIYSLTHLPNGGIFCGGARMNGILGNDTLSPVPGGTDGAVTHGVRLSNGDLVVAGSFGQFDGLATPVFARQSQGQWLAMPAPSPDTVYVYAMAAGPDGSVVVASVEQTATSRPVRLHRWQAGEWERLTPPFTASAVAVLPTGSIVISSASQPRVAILQDNSWNVVAVPGATSLQGLYAPQNGDVYVIDVNGTSPIAEQRTRILRLDGTTWTQVGTDLNTLDGFAAQVSQLVIYEGTVVLGGTFGISGVATSVVQLQPTGWKTLGSNLRDVASLVVHPTGELWAAGNHSPPGNLRERSMSVARWTGSHWQAVAPPVRRVPAQQLTLEPTPDPTIAVIVPAADGRVDVVGDFDAVESHGVAGFATLVASTRCDSIDFNNNTVFPEDADVIAFFNVLAGAECAVCNDMDFNNNGVTAEDQDVIDFFNVLAGGTCP